MLSLLGAALGAHASAIPLSRRGIDFHCPEEDIAATGCQAPRDCVYADPNDCHTYIRVRLPC